MIDNGKAEGRVLPVFAKEAIWTEDERRTTERHPEAGARFAYAVGVRNFMALDLASTHHLDLLEKKERHARPYGRDDLLPANRRATAFMRHLFSACDYLDARCNLRIYRPERPISSRLVIAEMPGDLRTPPEILRIFEGLVLV